MIRAKEVKEESLDCCEGVNPTRIEVGSRVKKVKVVKVHPKGLLISLGGARD